MDRNSVGCGAAELAGAVRQLYLDGQTDYSLEPLVLADAAGQAIGRIEDGDAVIFCCRRGEREIQLTEAFTDPEMSCFPRKRFGQLPFVILTLYHEKFKDLPVAFAPAKIEDTLAEVLSHNGLRQLHLSESEKFSHVTFFFNGGNHAAFMGETDVRIPSPRGTPFEQIPELSLPAVDEALCQGLREGYDFIVANFANGDVIGHTQNRESKILCAACVDTHLGKVVTSAQKGGYTVLVTADHGNLEQLYTAEGKPHVSHTANPVPFILVAPNLPKSLELRAGKLGDIAPTVLSLLGINQPACMTGRSLITNMEDAVTRRVLMLILDGWGIGGANENNPIHLAGTPSWDALWSGYPHTCLEASGEEVGLQAGKAGNSEAGHMNMGAGRLVLQDDVRLETAIQDGSFAGNAIFVKTIEEVKQRHGRLHLIGLLSEKSSHGSINYPLALLAMAKAHGLEQIFIHVIFDGRSTTPGSAPDLLMSLERKMAQIGAGRVVSGMGRSIALDRDGNYHKTQAAYEALVFGHGRTVKTGG